MGKPKKGWFPPMAPNQYGVSIRNRQIVERDITIAWGDYVYWINSDRATYTIAPLGSDGKPDRNEAWTTVGPVDSDRSTSDLVGFSWTKKTPPPDQAQVFEYGLVEAPSPTAKIRVKIKV
jgi:hypothetical protein